MKKKGWRESGRKLSEALPAALRNPSNILRRSSAQQQQQAKKPLGPSLSWDPEHRSRSPSGSSRSRVHSDGSNDPSNSETPENDRCGIEEPRFELEITWVLDCIQIVLEPIILLLLLLLLAMPEIRFFFKHSSKKKPSSLSLGHSILKSSYRPNLFIGKAFHLLIATLMA